MAEKWNLCGSLPKNSRMKCEWVTRWPFSIAVAYALTRLFLFQFADSRWLCESHPTKFQFCKICGPFETTKCECHSTEAISIHVPEIHRRGHKWLNHVQCQSDGEKRKKPSIFLVLSLAGRTIAELQLCSCFVCKSQEHKYTATPEPVINLYHGTARTQILWLMSQLSWLP